MKRKLIFRNKKFLTVIYNNRKFMFFKFSKNITSNSLPCRVTKYTKLTDYANATYAFGGGGSVLVPIVTNSLVKRSRIKNKVYAYKYISKEEFYTVTNKQYEIKGE